MGFLSRVFGGSKSAATTQQTTADRPFRIDKPIIGFLNLLGDQGHPLADADWAALAPLFADYRKSVSIAPACQVLFIYCAIDAEGRIVGRSETIRDLAKTAGAYVVVIASENPSEHYIKAVNGTNDWHANIVLTIGRNGERFARFYERLFEKMFTGKSMLMAWVELAPQTPGHEHHDTPEGIMLAEAGHVVFGR